MWWRGMYKRDAHKGCGYFGSFRQWLIFSEVREEFPELTEDDIKACIKYASAKIQHPRLIGI